ncbi:MAG TPA: elongation factor P [Candidatus Magasanikbacteria bacterium]|nr:MAG: elongation factor P [Candidatus Magasanikbacteria bacterium RIFOXYC2_FULL_39_8]HAT04053.1 elongation factor P [Candidatus Magasanikbacteria bacterium]
MGDTTDIRKGAVIRHNNELYVVTSCQFVNPGKGQAFTKTKLKNISSGKGTEMTYKSGENVDVVEVQRQNIQFLYKNGEFFSFMNTDSYETLDVSSDIIGDDTKYLKEGIMVIASLYEGNVVAIQLPKKIVYKVITAPPAVKGDTAGGNVTKEVELDNGLKIHVPIFIKEGEEILVNTETGEYGGRSAE